MSSEIGFGQRLFAFMAGCKESAYQTKVKGASQSDCIQLTVYVQKTYRLMADFIAEEGKWYYRCSNTIIYEKLWDTNSIKNLFCADYSWKVWGLYWLLLFLMTFDCVELWPRELIGGCSLHIWIPWTFCTTISEQSSWIKWQHLLLFEWKKINKNQDNNI